jgi:hypothetical protein
MRLLAGAVFIPTSRASIGLAYDGAAMQAHDGARALHASVSLRPLIDLASVWRILVANHMHSYRPEKHYMRGPGPKWREKQAREGAAQS